MDNIATERRACIHICLEIGKNPTETFESIRLAFGDVSLSRCVTFHRLKRFKDGRLNVDHRPSTSKPNDSLVRNKIFDTVDV